MFSTTSHYPPLVGVGEGRLAMARATPRDLVQDAATDCSFVASLSAAAARNDKGHSSVSERKGLAYFLSPNTSSSVTHSSDAFDDVH